MGLKPSAATIRNYFGSWNRARELAGVKIFRFCSTTYSDTEMLDAMKAHPDLGGRKWIKRRIKPSPGAIQKRFGSWNRARELAGLEVRPRGGPNDGLSEEERERIVREALKKDPTTAEVRYTLRRYASTYLKLTDGWAEETFKKWTGKREV